MNVAFPVLSIALVLAVFSASCGDASGSVTGGEPRFDAALPVAPVVDSGVSENAQDITWTGLYTDYFGARAPGPGCAGEVGSCHGAATDPGAQASGFTCGASKDTCYAGLTSGQANLIDAGNPGKGSIFQILRHRDNGGTQVGSMPKRPASYFFSPVGIKRIEDWIGAGAKND
jgi:hypothetical protein